MYQYIACKTSERRVAIANVWSRVPFMLDLKPMNYQ